MQDQNMDCIKKETNNKTSMQFQFFASYAHTIIQDRMRLVDLILCSIEVNSFGIPPAPYIIIIWSV